MMPAHPVRSRKVAGVAALALLSLSAAHAAEYAYIANADSQEISVLALDPAKGTLSTIETVPVGGTVMPLAVSPDKKVLYAALRSQPFRVLSFAIDPTSGKLRKLGEAPLADSMANIDTDRSGKWLFAASYPGHKITVNSIGKDGAVGAIQQLIPTAPNAHAIHADATNRSVFATSLGGDQLSAWRFDEATGQLSANSQPLTLTDPKTGPRHFVWDKAQKFMYVLCELDASLYVYAYDAAAGTLRQLQRSTVLPPGFSGKPWAADLHLGNDGRFLYASERTTSTLATFQVNPATGLVQLVNHVPTEKTPRGFAIDPSGRWLLSTGQESHGVAVHAIDPANGTLSQVQRYALGKNPNWVEIVELP
ncbi:MAG TPA: lactonase family protein [Ideonella sp.]|uniref:lactonase family protein n=1 Tax=Ideonella sp. TaxID=1929293 RepID=UPI002CFD6CCE|nr:lactonase family protein [Ideonella sp.]HSI48560.1 lactonase family protein [Ideonella sp.]